MDIKLIKRSFKEDDEKIATNTYVKEAKERKKYPSDLVLGETCEEEMIQCGRLAHKYDPTISKCLDYLCTNAFMFNDVSLFKNLISMGYDKYSDEVFDALFKIERDRSMYQNGSSNLVDAFFELSNGKSKVYTNK